MNISALSSNMTILIAISFLAVALSLLGFAVHSALGQNKVMSRRLAGLPGNNVPTRRKKRENVFAGLSEHLTMPDSEEVSRIRYYLAKAGYYQVKAVPTFYAIRVLSLVVPQFILLGVASMVNTGMSTGQLIFAASSLIMVGFFGPSLYVRSKVKKRWLQAKDGFPDMMDLLVACIEAGLGLDAALMNVADELGERYPVLNANLDLMNLELRAGRSRHESLKNFGDRLGLDEAKALALMLKQSEEMGSSLGASLRTFSEEMREKRMLLAEEKAMALSAKLTVPLIVFIFPTIMLMLLLPAGIRLSGAF